jgi:hypothetical protein
MTPQELLEQQRAATRIAPGGARSTVYRPPAGQVPQGVLSAGTAPMPANRTFIQPPNQAGSPALRAAIEGRPAIDPGIVQRAAQGRPTMPPGMDARLAQVQGMPGSTGNMRTALGAGPAAGVTPQGVPQARLDQVRNMPGRIPAQGMAPPTTGNAAAPGTGVFSPTRAAVEATDSRMPRVGAAPGAAPATAQTGGRIAGAARSAGRAVGMAGAGIGEVARTAGRLAGGIAGPMQALQGVEQMTGDGGMLDKAGGAVRTGAGAAATLQAFAPGFTSKVLPRLGPAGAAAAIGMTAGDAAAGPIMEWVRGNPGALKLLNAAREAIGSPALTPLGQQVPAAPPPNVYGPTVAEQNGVPQPVTTDPALDPRGADERAVAKADNAAPPRPGAVAPRGPVSRAAQAGGMSPEAQAQVARLQQMAGQPQMAPASNAPTDPALMGPGQLGVVGTAYGGEPDAGNVARPIYGMTLPGMPEEQGGRVDVYRGNTKYIATPDGSGYGYDEQLAGIPRLQGQQIQDVANWAVDLESKGLGKAGDIITRYLASLEAADAGRYGAELGLQGDQTRAGSAVEAARINADAQAYDYQPGQKLTDVMGNTTYTTPAVINRRDGTVRQLPSGQPQRQRVPAKDFDAAVQAVQTRDKVDAATARRRVESVYERGE